MIEVIKCMNVDILNKKLELIQWLSTLEDQSIIEKLLKLQKEETEDWWISLPNEEKESIDRGIAQADNNELEPHLKARNLYEKWL